MKQKHKWCRELLTFLMKKPYDSYYGANTKPLRNVSGTDSKTTYDLNKEDTIKDMCETSKSEDTKKSETLKSEDAKKLETLKIEEEKKAETLKSETPILTAARYVAVENRRTVVVESIRKWSKECAKKEVFDSLIRQVDNEDNTMLHLAATPSGQDWNIHGAALQLMWHIKWFQQYVKGLVPKHFTIKTNKKNKTAGETFKDKHNCLVQKGSEWLKTTSESCSVVAGLLAGVSFATSSTIPGGNKGDTGEPALEGKLPFDTFAMSSLIGLCFSVTALIMFLSILVSRKEAIDFRIDLPRKLLWGLSSLFLSIIAMFIAFCSGNFFLIDQKYKQIVLPIYIFTCFPVTLYAILYIELLRGILTKIPMRIDKGEDL
uniref:Uncharacterized protein LOC105851980 isoform X3 n=1 Tax=Cicer arietinum TaxID=3827 RepID=A0A1S3E592_CICAR|nr:uncharacterized protein LOC105851980 isoform X3 [Cicer arietinum]